MMMTNYMEVLMSNQPWNLIAFMVLPVAMAELLTAAELFILARPETSAGWKKLSHGLGIALGLYFLGVFLCFILHILPGISFRGWIDKLAIVAYLAGVLPLARPTVRICVPAEGDGKAGKDGNGSLVFTGLAFHGVPSGHEFNSFVLGLYNAAGPGQPLGDDLVERAKSITDPLNIMILVSLTCTMCPETVLASQRIASLSPAVRAEAYDVSHFPELKDQYGAMSVPCIVITHADGTQQVEFGKKSIPQMLELVGA